MNSPSIMKLGLLGRNIQYSLSPAIHNSSAKLLGLNIEYQIFDMPPDDVEEFLKKFWTSGGTGLNITTPYKETVAKIIKSPLISVNTIYRGEDGWLGSSTDGEGFLNSLGKLKVSIKDFSNIVILGSGGVVLGIIETLIQKTNHRIDLHILRRNSKNDHKLTGINSENLKCFLYDFEPSNLEFLMQKYTDQLVVQATSAPHQGDDLRGFVPAFKNFKGVFCDLVYGKPSAILDFCIKNNIINQDGLAMLIEQAMIAQKIWWGKFAYPEIKDLK